jgi:hypothetical protein
MDRIGRGKIGTQADAGMLACTVLAAPLVGAAVVAATAARLTSVAAGAPGCEGDDGAPRYPPDGQ